MKQNWQRFINIKNKKKGQKRAASILEATLFLICQACSLPVWWKSRMRVTVLIISQMQGCPLRSGTCLSGGRSEGSKRQIFEPTNRNFILGGSKWMMLLKKQKSNTARNLETYIKRLHEQKGNELTLRDLFVCCRRYARMPKKQQVIKCKSNMP